MIQLFTFGRKKLSQILGAMLLTASALTSHSQYLNTTNSFASTVPLGGEVTGTSVKRDALGNTYVTGTFLNTADFDPGPAVYNLTAVGGSNVYIAKYGANGELIYARQLECNGAYSTGLSVDNSGNTIIAGTFYGTIDFDPGPGLQSATAVGSGDIFIAKYDTSGNYVFGRRMGGSGDDRVRGMATDPSGNIIIAGYYTGTADMDPGPAEVNITSAGSNDAFFAKYNSSGDYIFARSLGSTNFDQSYAVTTDGSGNIYVTGLFMGTVDFDPSPATQNLVNTSSLYADIFVAKYSSSGGYVWAKAISGPSNEMANAIAVDASSNVYISGQFTNTVDFDPSSGVQNLSASASYDAFFAKYNANGLYVWAKSIGVPAGTSPDIAYGLALDASANVYVTGYFSGSPDFDPGAGVVTLTSTGNYDIFLAKYTTAGVYVYAKGMGGTNNDQGNSLIVDAAGNTYLAGQFTYTANLNPGGTAMFSTGGSSSHNNSFVGKYGPTGNYLWASQIGTYSQSPLNDAGSRIVKDAAGNTYIMGTFMGTMDTDPGPGVYNIASNGGSDIFVSKYDASGAILFSIAVGGINSETPGDLAVDATGNIYITGAYYDNADFDPSAGTQILSNAGLTTAFIAKYSPVGNYVFAKHFLGTGASTGMGIALDVAGNIHLTGYISGTTDMDPGAGVQNLSTSGQYDNDIVIAKYDNSGNYLWAKNIGSTSADHGRGIAVDASGNIYFTGFFSDAPDFDPGPGTVTLTSNGSYDIFLAKFSATGNFVWAKSVGSTSADQANGIVLDAANNVYLTGIFSSTLDFDPGAGVQNLTSAGNYDIFAAKYTTDGDYVYAQKMGGTSADYGLAIRTDASGNAYVTGYFTGTAEFGSTGNSNMLTSAGGTDIFVTKLNASGVPIYTRQIGGTGPDVANALFIENEDLIYLTGSYTGTANFNMGGGTPLMMTAGNGTDVFFTTYSNVVPLPLTLLQFNAVATPAKTVHTTWEVKPEEGSYFGVERSQDAYRFETVGQLAGGDRSSHFSFTDIAPYTSMSYYRLRLESNDGKTTYSRTIAVNITGDKAVFNLSSNPLTAGANLQISSSTPLAVKISVTDMYGKTVFRNESQLEAGRINVPLQLDKVSTGLLMIIVTDNNGNLLWQSKAVKQ